MSKFIGQAPSRRSWMMGAGAALTASVRVPASQGAGDNELAVASASYDLTWGEGQLSGPGAERLLAAASRAQFLIVVESHNDHVTPLLTAALFSRLNDIAGYDYVAIEQDPWGMESASSSGLRGNLTKIADYARRYPYSFTFSTDEELRLLAQVGETSSAEEPIWGVDQLFGAAGPLEELSHRRRADPWIEEVDAMRAAALAMESQRGPDGRRDPSLHHFMSIEAERVLSGIGRIRSAGSGSVEPRAGVLMARLEQSARIYAANARANAFNEDGVPLGLLSNKWREDLMKTSFMSKYRRAREGSGSIPRVIAKAGYWHAVRGRGPGNVFTLGAFLHELAIAEGGRAVSVQILPLREWWPTYDSIDPEYRVVLRPDAMGRSTLVDLQPIRGRLHAGRTFGLTAPPLARLRNMAFGLDYLLFTPSTPGAHQLTTTV